MKEDKNVEEENKGIINKAKNLYNRLKGTVNRFICTITVYVEVTSPYYPSKVVIGVSWFKRKEKELTMFTTPLTKDYKVDLGKVAQEIPFDYVQIKVPSDWEEQVEEAKDIDNKIKGMNGI